MNKENEPVLERLLRLQKIGYIKDIEIKIQPDAEGVDPRTHSAIHPVTQITIEKRNGSKVNLSVESLTGKK